MNIGVRKISLMVGMVSRSLSLATDRTERILNILESLSKAIYDKK